ncbi:MAG: PqiC family protein [Deltaproteobacteria bacterium]|nr:PqiC family protein [Deltaproteobacteria bacterium]
MRPHAKKLSGAAVTALLALVLGLAPGCLGSSPRTQFYMLNSLGTPATDSPAGPEKTARVVAVGPVELPAYLDRPQIVLRQGPNQLEFTEFEHWAEPLDKSFSRVLLEDLTNLLNSQDFRFYPWRSQVNFDFQVAVNVLAFEGNQAGQAVLTADWLIFRGRQDPQAAARGHSHIVREIGAWSTASLVAAQSGALAELAREIAAALGKLK